MAQGTSPQENWKMVLEEIKRFPHGRIFHKLLNVLVEKARLNPRAGILTSLGVGIVIGGGMTWLLT